MAKIEGTSSSAKAAFAAEAELKAARKNAELEAGQVILTAAVKQNAKEKKEREEERTEKEERKDNSSRDTKELSKQSKWFGIEGKLLEQENIKWSLEMEKLWETFINWLPDQTADLSDQLEELSKLYLALLEAVLTHTMGEDQAAAKEQLDAVLAQKLNLLLETDLKELIALLEKAEQTEAVDLIKTSVYKQTTGESVSARTAKEFLAGGKAGAGGHSRFFMPETSGTGRSDTGVLYKRAGGGNVQVNQEFNAYKSSGELQMSRRNAVLSGGKEEGGSLSLSGRSVSYTGKELQAANSFASHVNGSGNLLKNSGISAQNDEVTGYLAALTSLKGQIYAETAGRENSVKVPVKSALNQFIDYYLTQKGAYKVYYYTTNAYERTKSAARAAEEGLEYAYRQFLEKKNDEAYRGRAAYSERAGFFQALRKDLTMEEELRRGLLLLEKNWKEFLNSIGENERKDLLVAWQKYSRWGELMRPESREKDRDEKMRQEKRERIMMAQIICLAALGAVYVFYRLFFG